MSTWAGKAAYWSVFQVKRFAGTDLLRIQWAIVLAGVLLMVFHFPVPRRLVAKAGSPLKRFAMRRKTAVLACGVLSMGIRAAVLPVLPVPLPSVHDEFSQLLLGDTFASGRITNPPHPLWTRFESIHIIQQPTYASMYPPAFGAFLALGEKVAGEPWVGVWLATGLMCAALCWMLQGWLPPFWAFIGGLIAVFTIGIPGFWMNSYIGGSVPALGGALAMGALPRLTRGCPAVTTLSINGGLMAAGFALLLASRPFEGGILGLLTGLALALAWIKQGLLRRRLLSPVVIGPFCLIMGAALAFTLYYSWRVTHNPLKMPYEVNRETYGWPENLAILPPVKVTPRHKDLQDMHALEISHRQAYSTFGRTVDSIFYRMVTGWNFYSGPALTAPLLFLPFVIRDRRTRVPTLIGLAMCALNLLQLMLYPQHLAAITGVIFLAVTQGLRHLRAALVLWRPAAGPRFAAVAATVILLCSGVKLLARPLGIQRDFWDDPREGQQGARAAIVATLSARSRPQLVIVRYRNKHNPNEEWIYNAADIDRSHIVWAREMDSSSNRSLLCYFASREKWLLEADAVPPRLIAYSAQ